MKLSIQNINTYVLKVPQKTTIAFTGDKMMLEPYITYGLTTQKALFSDEYFINRPDVNIDQLLQKLQDNHNNNPFLITGSRVSGKSVTAGRLAELLKKQGHKVFIIDNKHKEEEYYLNLYQCKRLIQEIESVDPDKKVFVFIDEPHLIPIRQFEEDKNLVEKTETNVLRVLSNYLAENDNVKLVGVMFDAGFNEVENLVNKEQRVLMEEMFPQKNHIVLPTITTLGGENLIKMVNNGLKTAGFHSIPDRIAKKLLALPKLPDVSEAFRAIKKGLGKDLQRRDDKAVMEDIKPEIWNKIVFYLEPYKDVALAKIGWKKIKGLFGN